MRKEVRELLYQSRLEREKVQTSNNGVEGWAVGILVFERNMGVKGMIDKCIYRNKENNLSEFSFMYGEADLGEKYKLVVENSYPSEAFIIIMDRFATQIWHHLHEDGH